MKKYLISAAAAVITLTAAAQNKQGNVLDLKHSIQDSQIVYPESFETDTQKLLEGWYLKNYTSASDFPAVAQDTDPGASDALITQRLADMPTVIDMPFNSIVKQYIERYTKKGRRQVTALLGLSSYYMPIFEQALEEAGLPMELKYLPVIESGLNPNAVSKHGAAGLWQFIVSSAKGYDMEVTSLVDERRDPYISSERACRMLKDLYNAYGDWSLAIAAYNCGPGTVNKALTRAGGDPKSHDFWSIYYFLPQETRGYVPLFIAANYVMTYYPEHGISPVLITKPLVTDTISVSNRVHFNQISEVLKIPVEELRILNPQFRSDIVPGTAAHPYNLILPSQQVHAYIVSEEQILNYERDLYARRTTATPGGDPEEAVDITETSEVINPDDLARQEAEASQAEYIAVTESTQATTPRRRRHDAQPSTATQTAAAAESPESSTASPTSAYAASRQNKPSSSSTDTTPSSTKKKNNTATASSSSNGSTKKNTNASSASSGSGKGTKTNKKTQQTATPKSHTVASGENLTVIAKKNGTTVEAIRKANPNLKGDIIHPGDKINMPKAQKSSQTKTTSKSTTSKTNTSKTKKKKK